MPDATDSLPAMPRHRLRARAVDAWHKVLRSPSALIIANTGIQSVLRMGSNIVLARLLAPSAFAQIAITMLVLTGITMVSDVGIAITALREGAMSREDEAKLWTMQLVRNIGVALLMLAAAAPVGWIYGDPQLRDTLFALALMPLLQGVQSLYPVLALAHRRLLPSTLLEIGGRVAGMVASILIALVSPTVWSLVIGTLAGVAVTSLGGHLVAGYRPRFLFDWEYIKKQWRFSRWIQTSSTLTFVGMQIDKALFPFLFGMTALGVYGIGAAFAAMPAQVTQRWSATVFYPLATQLLRGDRAARAQLIRVRTTMLLYCAVLTLAVVAISPAFFTLLYEPRYRAAAQFAQILALGIFFDVGEASLRHLPLVEGTPQYEVWAVVVRLAAFGAAALAVLAFGGGAPSYALAVVFGAATSHGFMLVVCARRGYLRFRTDLLLTPPLVAAAAAFYFFPLPRANAWAIIAEGAVVGLAAVGALVAIYLRRGLPSLPAEPAPAALREAAEEELNTAPTAV